MYTLLEYQLCREKLYKVVLFAVEILKFSIYVKSIQGFKNFKSFLRFYVHIINN